MGLPGGGTLPAMADALIAAIGLPPGLGLVPSPAASPASQPAPPPPPPPPPTQPLQPAAPATPVLPEAASRSPRPQAAVMPWAGG
eukprot:2480134-Prymnesium_polylepis.1